MSYIIDCENCSNRCDGKSKGTYIFESDADYSERREQLVIDTINALEGYSAKKCEKDGYPDIEVHKGDKLFYIEIKAQRRTFMSVGKLLPESDLVPSETMALNLSDLERYIGIKDRDGVQVFIMWCLENRPCVVKAGETKFFFNDVNEFEALFAKYGDKRRFRRKSGAGDVVNGQHKGVVVNYHFSLDEMIEARIENGFGELTKLVK